MALQAICPVCQASYNLPESQAGRRVRCKQCESVFTVEPAEAVETRSQRNRAAADDEFTAQPAPRSRPALAKAPSNSAAPTPGKSHLPLIVGGIVGCVALLTVGAIAVAMILKPETPPAAPVVQAGPSIAVPLPVAPQFPTEPATPVASVVEATTARPLDMGGEGRMSKEIRDKVKQATVFLAVTFADGRKVSGTGFFGVPEAKNLVLTNAHVVGMLAPESRKPQSVMVHINSGESNRRLTSARVVGVDRHSDLAILDIGTTDATPAPLKVRNAATLNELDQVFVFGFPLGRALGEEITIRPTSVSSFRRRNGVLERVQVAGGMDPGNSGGPVVDANGDVVAVAVSGVEGRLINFAIPGERVLGILGGRLSQMNIGVPFQSSGKVGIPIEMEMIDPRNKIERAAIEVWTGTNGMPLGASNKQPEPRLGDSDHVRVDLNYAGGIAKGEVDLPTLPAGKVYWLQPVYVTEGKMHWADGQIHKVDPEMVVDRKPAKLFFHNQSGSNHPLSLDMKNTFRIGEDEEGVLAEMTTHIDFQENVAASDTKGTTLRMAYKRIKRSLSINKTKRDDPRLGAIEPHLQRLVAVLKLDPKGNPIENGLDGDKLNSQSSGANRGGAGGLIARPGAVRPGAPRPSPSGPEDPLTERLKEFHRPMQSALDSLSIALPNEDNVAAGRSWHEKRSLPLESPGRFEVGELAMKYTYLGTRNRLSRSEAVIALEGFVRGKDGDESISGLATGLAVVDLASGVITMSNVKSVLDLEALIQAPGESGGRPVRVIAVMDSRLDRGLQ